MEREMPRNASWIIEGILSRGIDLKEFGSASWAFDRAAALDAISNFFEFRIPMLGGDVWTIKNGRPSLTHDNWCYARSADEPFESFVERSIERARKYVQSYRCSQTNEYSLRL